MMTGKMLFLRCLLVSLLLSFCARVGMSDLLGRSCPDDTAYDSNTTSAKNYKTNLNSLLSALISIAFRSNGFYNLTVGSTTPSNDAAVYGLFLCRGDVQASACRECVTTASSEILSLCPDRKVATIWYDHCMLRYSNISIFSSIQNSVGLVLSDTQNATNVTLFGRTLQNKLADLETRAANDLSGKKFAVGEANSSSGMIYALEQCTPDLSITDCGTCLRSGISNLSTYTRGARFLYPTCNARYELYPFYKTLTSPPEPALPPPPETTPPPPPETTPTRVTPETTPTQGLRTDFYDESCPKLKSTVKSVIHEVMSVAPSLGAPLLRMHFHDCFVRGCDGSVLLDITNQSEKYSPPNLSLRGYQIIDKVKTAVEEVCPGVVSCADVLALVAMDVTAALNGPFWEVEFGRRDGRVSRSNEALNDLIPPFANISTLKQKFLRVGLSVKDLVVLSGGHTIGTSHCSSFEKRLYNFTGKGIENDSDPTLDSNYVARLKLKCKPGDPTTLAEMTPGSFKTFDASFYTLVAKRRGLFQSDAALLDDSETKAYVNLQATQNYGATFFKDFGDSMIRMGRIGVLTGTHGEIRKVCTKVN